MAILLKGVAAFFTLGLFLALSLYRSGLRGFVSRQTLAFVVLSLAPTVLFYAYSASQGMLKHAAVGFLPHLLLEPAFWQLWLKQIHEVIGFTWLVVALLGLLVATRDRRLVILLSLWVAYLAYGFAKNYHIHTHPYYQLPLVPIVALSIGPVFSVLLSGIAESRKSRFDVTAGTAVAFFALLLVVGIHMRDRGRRPDYGEEVRIAEAIGEHVSHSRRVVVLGPTEERPLRYHGKFAGTYWPDLGEIASEQAFGLRSQTTEERFGRLEQAWNPEYFVVRDLAELARQPELEYLLRSRYRLVAENDKYVIFDLHSGHY